MTKKVGYPAPLIRSAQWAFCLFFFGLMSHLLSTETKSTTSGDVHSSRFADLEHEVDKKVDSLLVEFDCQHFYVDMGSNIGVQIRKLYEPWKYPGAPVHDIFQNAFGSDRCKVCSIGFEPDPEHENGHGEIQVALRKAGGGVLFLSAAVGSRTGYTKYFTGGTNSSVGGSATPAHNMKNGNTHEIPVQVVDIPRLLIKLHNHLVQKGGGNRTGKIVSKCDIEGTEFELVPSLIFTQTFCLIDHFYSEWHGHKYSQEVLEKVASRNNIDGNRSGWSVLQSLQNAIHYQVKDMQKSPSCQTELVELDDETYLNDGVPLPVASLCKTLK